MIEYELINRVTIITFMAASFTGNVGKLAQQRDFDKWYNYTQIDIFVKSGVMIVRSPREVLVFTHWITIFNELLCSPPSISPMCSGFSPTRKTQHLFFQLLIIKAVSSLSYATFSTKPPWLNQPYFTLSSPPQTCDGRLQKAK